MIHVRVKVEAPPLVRGIQMTLVIMQFLLLSLNACYALLLFVHYIQPTAMDWNFLVYIRLYLYLFLGLVAFVGTLLIRKIQAHVRSPVSRVEDSRNNSGEQADNGHTPRSVHYWRLFESGFLVYALAVTFLQSARYDAFQQWFSFGSVHVALDAAPISFLLDLLTEVLFFLLMLYFCVKIPQVTGGLLQSFDRLYLGPWHIHESVFGILWALVGGAFVIFGGDVYDRAFGALYILMGAFFIGRDYLDVRNLKFIQKDTSEMPGIKCAGEVPQESSETNAKAKPDES
jgi:hypothetical protein